MKKITSTNRSGGVAMNPTDYHNRRGRIARRAADPATPVRAHFRIIMREAGLRLSDWALALRWSRKHPDDCTGHCSYDNHRITATIGVRAPSAHWRALLLHEVAHAVTPEDGGHGDAWRARFAELLAAVYGRSIPPSADVGSTHALHAAVVDALDCSHDA